MAKDTTLTDVMKRGFRELMKSVSTAIPGHVLSFEPSTQLAQVQIGIERVDVKGVSFTPPPLIEVPVFQYGGAGFIVECQIDPGDYGLIIFSQRCIDGWVNTGGVANNPILRFHDVSDAFFIPGFRPQPNTVSGHANNGVRMRNAAGDSYFWLKNDGTGEITVSTLTINGEMQHNGNAVRTGTLDNTGSVTMGSGGTSTGDIVVTSGDVTADGISLKTHVHGGVQTGAGTTGQPQ